MGTFISDLSTDNFTTQDSLTHEWVAGRGSLLYSTDTSGSVGELTVGTSGQILESDGTDPAWVAFPGIKASDDPVSVSGAWTFTKAGTALTVTNDATVSNDLSVGNDLDVTNDAVVDGLFAVGTTVNSDRTAQVFRTLTGAAPADDIGLYVAYTDSRSSGNSTASAIRGAVSLQASTVNISNVACFDLAANVAVDGNAAVNRLYSVRALHQWSSGTYTDSRINESYGVRYQPDANKANTRINSAYGLYIFPRASNASATLGTVRGLYCRAPTATGTLTTFRGIDIEDNSAFSAYEAIRVAANSTSTSATKGNINMLGGNWNTGHLQLENGHAWNDATNNCLRFKGSTPTGETDGTPFPLAHAEIYANDVDLEHTISGTGQANKVQITAFNANGQSFIDTPDHTNDHITIAEAGVRAVMVSMTLESVAGAAAEFGYAVYVNNGSTELTNLHGHRDIAGGGGAAGSISMSGLASFSASDTVEVWIWNETNTQNVKVDDINLSVFRIGS